MQWLPGVLFKQDNVQLNTTKVSLDCLCPVTAFPWPARSPDLSPIEHIWDNLRRQVGYPARLNGLDARLQQIWNEMSQDIIQNLYARLYHIMHLRYRGSNRVLNYPFFCLFL
ncbi:transposable element Tcb2 transposase [Trichonephila clavipes]|uniref:Transposable element Tcb2 transposase n=1 Tax=Trichonephila clavipes TaxID=2585209 RepID=A0A8X6RIW8_TRICX|nr:transposable element Tcb2 transposase [Trichonephila clavipes]